MLISFVVHIFFLAWTCNTFFLLHFFSTTLPHPFHPFNENIMTVMSFPNALFFCVTVSAYDSILTNSALGLMRNAVLFSHLLSFASFFLRARAMLYVYLWVPKIISNTLQLLDNCETNEWMEQIWYHFETLGIKPAEPGRKIPPILPLYFLNAVHVGVKLEAMVHRKGPGSQIHWLLSRCIICF